MSSSQANKLSVLAGFVSPGDPTEKQRPALVLAEIKVMGAAFIAVAPMTTHYERTGTMPAGAVPLRASSPAFASTHLSKDTALNLGNLVMVPADSKWLANTHEVGRLDLAQDKRLNAQVQDSMGQMSKLMQSHLPEIMKTLQQGDAVSMDTRLQAFHTHAAGDRAPASPAIEKPLTDTAKGKLLQAAIQEETGGPAPSLAEALQAIDKARESSRNIEVKLSSGERVAISPSDILDAIGERQHTSTKPMLDRERVR